MNTPQNPAEGETFRQFVQAQADGHQRQRNRLRGQRANAPTVQQAVNGSGGEQRRNHAMMRRMAEVNQSGVRQRE